MKNQQMMLIGGAAALIMLVIGVGVFMYGLSQSQETPTPETVASAEGEFDFEIPQGIELEPAASIEELVADSNLQAEYPELAELLLNPELGSVYKDFYLVYQQGGPDAAIALARQRGILNEDDQIVMTLILDTDDNAALVAELEAEGITIQSAFRDQVNIAIPIALIQEQLESEDPDLILERISNFDNVIRLELPNRASTKQSGIILGQGVDVTEADVWQDAGLTGQGVRVGVLDLGFGGYEDMLGSELPESVEVGIFGDDYAFELEVHGTACAEIVHEMAPGAELILAYYDGTDAAMGEAIEWLVAQEVDIITNSTGSNGDTPMDGTGLIAELIDEVYAQGILWVNAAGNEADVHYRGQFTDTDGDNLHEFAEDLEYLPFVVAGPGFPPSAVIMSWDDWDNVDQDYDLSLYDQEGNLILKSEDLQDGSRGQEPVEFFRYEFDTQDIYLLAIENYDGLADGDAVIDLFFRLSLPHPDFITPEYSLASPSDARGALAVAAVNWADDELEPYSSQGPTSDGRIKPDIAAPSVVDSLSYAPEAFDGTSAAAPHVAGAAALVLEAFPDYTPDEVIAFLEGRALDLGPPGEDNGFGAGRLDLGAAPDGTAPAPAEEEPATDAAEEEPVEVAEAEADEESEEPLMQLIQPTSTPRTSAPPSINLPNETDAGGSAEPTTPDVQLTEEELAQLGMFVVIGAGLMCLAGAVLGGIVIWAIVAFLRR